MLGDVKYCNIEVFGVLPRVYDNTDSGDCISSYNFLTEATLVVSCNWQSKMYFMITKQAGNGIS